MPVTPNSPYRLEQDSRYAGDDWWSWSVWLEGDDEDLDQVEEVEYTLHRSFRKPVRKVNDRATKFKLKTAGWGRFTIYATVRSAAARNSTWSTS